MPPVVPSTSERSALALGAWVGFYGLSGRALMVLALELAHHGDFALARLRLAGAIPSASGFAAGLALLATGAAGFAAPAVRRAARALLVGLGSAGFAGFLDPDASRRIGLDTPLGFVALACAFVLAFLPLGFLAFERPRALRRALAPSRRAALLPLAGAGALALRLAGGGLGPTMELHTVALELVRAPWQVLSARADAPPRPLVLCPSAEYSEEGAGRPALLLAPPARVRRTAPEGGPFVLRGGAGIDHAVTAELAERYPGHALRFRVRVDGVQAFETTLALAHAEAWVELGAAGAGLPIASGAELELETALLDAQDREVEPSEPLRAGFGDLVLERRTRAPRTRASAAHPNLVLVLIDTLRADRTSAYGYARATTPNLDALAARGVLFEDLSATASWTWPSTASILTGLLPEQHGVVDAQSSFLPQELDTLPEALQRAGVTTAAWSGSPLIVPAKHFDQGFEFFDASREGRLRRSDIVLPSALDWLGAASEWRFFLYLHLMEPHAPYAPLPEGRARFAAEVPASFDPHKTLEYPWALRRDGFSKSGVRQTETIVPAEEQRWISDLYDGGVWSADHYLGLVLARLRALGLEENTLVVVTSDHGEELFDHGLLAHTHSLHRELVRVPLVLAGPGVLPRGGRVREALSAVALGPTLARLCGAELEGLSAAHDLFDGWRVGGGAEAQPCYFSTRQGWWNGVANQPLFGLRLGSYVLHYAPEGQPWGVPRSARDPDAQGEVRLYISAQDPAELQDLAPRLPELTLSLRDDLLRHLAGLATQHPQSGVGADEATLGVLRALGYLGK